MLPGLANLFFISLQVRRFGCIPILTSPQFSPLRQNCYPVLQTCSLYPYKSAGLAAPLRQKCHLHMRTCFLYPNKSAVLVAPLKQNATRTCADLFLLKQFKNKLIPLRENKSASPRASFVCENRGETQHLPDLCHKRKQVRKSVVVFRMRKQGENDTFAGLVPQEKTSPQVRCRLSYEKTEVKRNIWRTCVVRENKRASPWSSLV